MAGFLLLGRWLSANSIHQRSTEGHNPTRRLRSQAQFLRVLGRVRVIRRNRPG
jgi:hypothetical protein